MTKNLVQPTVKRKKNLKVKQINTIEKIEENEKSEEEGVAFERAERSRMDEEESSFNPEPKKFKLILMKEKKIQFQPEKIAKIQV